MDDRPETIHLTELHKTQQSHLVERIQSEMAETGMIPPVARRKLMMRKRKKQLEDRRNMILLLVFFSFAALFAFYSMQRGFKSVNNASIKSFEDVGKIGFIAPKTDTTKLRRGQRSWITQDSQPFNKNLKATKAQHLILVAGHSVTVSGHLEDAGVDESDWYLLDYQKGKGLPQAIAGHINAGIILANRDPDSLLIFSGGETRAVTGPLTEGGSYFHVADAMNLWPPGSTVRARTVTEEFATDSFENLMFSICRFKEVTGNYPTKISVVSFSFKQRRFETLHAPALGWPKERFAYVGFDPPLSTGFDLKAAEEGESQNAALPFESDPYGCNSPVLQQKRKERNPYSRTAPYPLSCPDMKELLSYCGPGLIPKERLPWGNKD